MFASSELELVSTLNYLQIFGDNDSPVTFNWYGKQFSISCTRYRGSYIDDNLRNYEKFVVGHHLTDSKQYIILSLDNNITLTKIFYKTDIVGQFEWIRDKISEYIECGYVKGSVQDD
jgi:hypothetical protein